MDTNNKSNNEWICKFCKKSLSKKYNYQSHMDRCKVYKDHLKSNSLDDEFKEQLKYDILNEVKMFLDDLKNEFVNAKTNNNIRQNYSFNIS